MAHRSDIEQLAKFAKRDLSELVEATEAAIRDGSGFGWVEVPTREVLERYWKGVLLMPRRTLFVARLDGVIGGSIQLVEPPPGKEMYGFAAAFDTHFVAPWARGHGRARELVSAAEGEARRRGYRVLNISVTATQARAIEIYEAGGYVRWGTHPKFALVRGAFVPGHYYMKDL